MKSRCGIGKKNTEAIIIIHAPQFLPQIIVKSSDKIKRLWYLDHVVYSEED